MFAAVYAAEGTDPAALVALVSGFSPRFQAWGPREIVLDARGLRSLFGESRAIGEALRRSAADRGVRVRVALAATATAARLLVHARAGVTVVEPGTEAAALAPLPLAVLASQPQVEGLPPVTILNDVARWAIRTLGEFTALPEADVAARLGQDGVRWQAIARGEDPHPLVPSIPEERFEQSIDLEWPIEGLEPLAFVLGRLFDPLAAHLDRRDRGAAVLHVRLDLVTREAHARSLHLPVPMRDPRTLRTLALLDLEAHPPTAAIDRVTVAVEPTPARVLQYSLLTRPTPSVEQVATLTARLSALMGQDRCGSPAPVDSWQPGAFTMTPFAPPVGDAPARSAHTTPAVAVRRFRHPVIARVALERGAPVRVTTDRAGLSGGRVEACAGPWRTSGGWWESRWHRDEWDVALADGVTYRIVRDEADRWLLDGVLD